MQPRVRDHLRSTRLDNHPPSAVTVHLSSAPSGKLLDASQHRECLTKGALVAPDDQKLTEPAERSGLMATEDKVVIGQTHGSDDPEAVLIGYLLDVEALRAGKQALMWLTKDGIHVATDGYVDGLSVPGAPSITDLHAEYVEKGGRFFACPVCVKTRGLESAVWVKGAEVKGAPSLYEFTEGGALTFNY
jgi:predicted peroxiredoxin